MYYWIWACLGEVWNFHKDFWYFLRVDFALSFAHIKRDTPFIVTVYLNDEIGAKDTFLSLTIWKFSKILKSSPDNYSAMTCIVKVIQLSFLYVNKLLSTWVHSFYHKLGRYQMQNTRETLYVGIVLEADSRIKFNTNDNILNTNFL